MTDIYKVSNYTPCQIGLVKGEQGIRGDDGLDGLNGLNGVNGINGKDAYQLAVDAGFIGTIGDYRVSLKGDKGDKGDAGVSGTGVTALVEEAVGNVVADAQTQIGTAITDTIISSGFVTVDSFELGATITQRNQALRHAANGKLYRWSGNLPKVVPASSTPTNSGGIAANAWLEVSDQTLRSDILIGGLVTDSVLVVSALSNAIGAIARTQAEVNAETISAKAFGAKGDGVTDDTIALQKANNYATTINATLVIGHGDYKVSNVDITTNTKGSGKILGKLTIRADSITISDISIDGGYVSPSQKGQIGLEVYGKSDVTIKNVTVRNCITTGIRGESATRLLITNCTISGIRGTYGDGICFNRSTDCTAAYNNISDINRIGIVSDTDVLGLKSRNIRAINNTIYNANGSTGGEINGGIWFENTLGGIISGNIITNTNERGVIITPLIDDEAPHLYVVSENIVTNADIGYAFAQSNTGGAQIKVSNCSVLGTYSVGMDIEAANNVDVIDCYFEDATKKSFNINAYNNTKTCNVNITNCKKGNEGTTNDVSNVTVDISASGNSKLNLSISDMVGTWFYLISSSSLEGTLRCANTKFRYAANSNPVYLTNFSRAYFSNCELIINTDVTVQGNIELKLCDIYSPTATVYRIESKYGAPKLKMYLCDVSKISVSMTHSVLNETIFMSCSFKNYGSKGAIVAYYNSGNWNLKVYECTFKDSAANVPIKSDGGVAPTCELRNVFHPSVDPIAGFTASISSGVMLAP